ncbi:dihydrofolate reductase [Rhodocytophaga rosea]|uniref:Dihydrofolate reductase n=1 Tax=Rhodocytophaga rosea TaxID=2704465 RepID=A0A6C0GUU8_9BACT|nr:dihydrofolate reductase [Rhodocytophaga rosea]QHT71584.1 dihydrofolate reductase [Rhodocytophaga rosea]
MQIIIVAAHAQNRVIGRNNELVWHLPRDFKHFKEITVGHPIIMGRKTFESLGKPLPNRTSIIITRDAHYQQEGCIVVHSLKEAIAEAKKLDDQIYIIGGAEIYKQALPYTQKMYLTEVKAFPEGDAYFPEFSKTDWQETARHSYYKDEKNEYDFDFVTWERKDNIAHI